MAVSRKIYLTTEASLPEVKPDKADVAWLIYDLQPDSARRRHDLTLSNTIYTQFKPALDKITMPEPGPIEAFIEQLQNRLDEKLEDNNPPDAPTLTDLLEA